MNSPQIDGNHFLGNQRAVVSLLASRPQIRQNRFEANAVALANNQLGRPMVGQKFLAASGKAGEMAIFTPASGVVDVSDNRWGRDVSQAAEQVFFARRQAKWGLDDTSGERYLRDQINYSPWLHQPVANAAPE